MPRRLIVRLGLLPLLVSALAGCSRSPLAPELGSPARTGGASGSVVQTTDPAPPPDEPLAPLMDQVALHPNEAGLLRAGRFTLEIPRKALRRQATIRMTQRDPHVMQVDITVTPASANDFKLPVHLTADCSSDDLDTVRHETLFWWQGGWREASAVSLTAATLTLHTYTQRLANARVDEMPDNTRTRTY